MNHAVKSEATEPSLKFRDTSVNIRLASADSADGISVIEHHMPKGEAPPLHLHRNEDEVFFLLDGAMSFEVAGQRIEARAGDVVMAPKGVAHRFIVTSASGARCLTIMRGGDFETAVRAVSVPANGSGPAAPDTDIGALIGILAANDIEVLGPPLVA